MIKLTRKTDFEVVVVPHVIYCHQTDTEFDGQANMLCGEIVAQIERHIDDVSSATIQSKKVCKFCSYTWDDDRGDKPPDCCDEANEAWETNQSEEQGGSHA